MMSRNDALHLVNGEATQSAINAAGIAGRCVSVDDVLVDGPLPDALAMPTGWAARDAWMHAHYGAGRTEASTRWQDAREAIQSAAPDDIVIWTEECLHCFANLLHLLATCDVHPDSWVVSSEGTPLGELSAGAFSGRYAHRETLGAMRLAVARVAWGAFAAPDPRSLESLARMRLAREWPMLARLAFVHLSRLPNPRTGLGVVEATLLSALDVHEPRVFPAVFQAFRHQAGALGFGDLTVARQLQLLEADGLVEISPEGYRATTAAVAALAARAPARLGAREIGGVVLAPGNPRWGWDGARVVPLPA